MLNARRPGLLANLLVFLLPGPALAWGDLGHRIICEIAFQELGSIARDRVKAMIDRDHESHTFAEACSWPDHPRRRASEHYVNLPRDADGLEEDPCPLATECVVSAITKDLAVLSSPSATEQERLEALKYLGHWVGDVHQPLHVSFEDDRGGNEVGVSGGLCSWNLHAVWDRCIIEHGLPGDPRSVARDLLDGVTDQDRATWQGSTPIDWANESFAISTSPEVQYCVGTDNGCWYGADNERLDQGEWERSVMIDPSYIEAKAPTVRNQLVKAGLRLGGLLEQALSE
jgi:S1/P1 Nuclease